MILKGVRHFTITLMVRLAFANSFFCSLVGRLLVREPGQRLSLTDILNHPWLVLAPNEPLPAPARPLVSRDQLNEDDHQHILQRMVEGKIASGDEIHRYM